ncbi:hypothetical protein G7Z17_g11833 [Cylindrodendrum hubeiense]|uniref:Uncharacterized protein n=1 Tax=Cylindrodendrum hubeiense TaxID=595255 RepID=A0A9P5L9V5_9HYPO|nr:hypothetical protein G7Z17_g11833 [Cylindrodendrum hubeiense]
MRPSKTQSLPLATISVPPHKRILSRRSPLPAPRRPAIVTNCRDMATKIGRGDWAAGIAPLLLPGLFFSRDCCAV